MKIRRIALPSIFGMKTVNSFILKGDEVVLIDAGESTPASMEALRLGLIDEGLEFSDIDRIVITHAHVDHIGMAQLIAEEANAKVWVNEKSKAYAIDPVGQWDIRKKLILDTIRSFFPVSMHAATEANYLSFSEKMADVWSPISEDILETYPLHGPIELCGELWTSIYMPGHSNTQSTFYHEDSGGYLAADMLLKISSTPVIEPQNDHPNSREKGILKMLQSYHTLSELDLKTVYPGHYEIFENGNKMIDIHLNRIRERVSQCKEIIKAHAPDPIAFLELFQEMYKGRWHMPALIMQIGYLDILEEEGTIQYDMTEGFKKVRLIQDYSS